MSGIFGICRFDGAPVDRAGLDAVAGVLKRRGPDRTGIWIGEHVALGQTLLATTPEAREEKLPLIHCDTGCVITADVRLDNRAELIATLGLPAGGSTMGDGELILNAYLTWGPECAARLLGDFAYAIWDPRSQRLVCARDKTGMRQLIYHHAPGGLFAFATETGAVLKVPGVPMRINEGRIADFLVGDLEGIDHTSTFFETIHRLPSAHSLVVDRNGMTVNRYWRLEVGTELKLASDEDYAEAFLEVFTDSVRARLRSPDPVGSMLSGGMDSGSVVAVGSRLLTRAGQGPLRTFSATGPDPGSCVETRAIHAALTMNGLQPEIVDYAKLGDMKSEMVRLYASIDEPFEDYMNVPRAMYLAAHRAGLKVVLDGVAGDLVLSHGDYITRLLRRGHWRRARAEIAGEKDFWGAGHSPWNTLLSSLFEAFAPETVFKWGKSVRRSRVMEETISRTPIDPDFASRIDLRGRLQRLYAFSSSRQDSAASRRRGSLQSPGLIVARERYDRVAGALAIEPRDPFMDVRVMEFCLRLPGDQLLRDGWPKYILRRSMDGLLPEAVRWRRGKEHLGPNFTEAVLKDTGLLPGPGERMSLPVEAQSYAGNLNFINMIPQSAAEHDWRSIARSNVMTLARWLELKRGPST